MNRSLPDPSVCRFIGAAVLAALAFAGPLHAVLFTNFNEAGTLVNGFQDDFNGPALNSDWLAFDGGFDDGTLFELSGNGSLLMHPANGDPNKLLYNPAAGYDPFVQEVLALVRVTVDSPGNTDGFRGGVTATSETGLGQGFNLHYREPGQPGGAPFSNHFNLLDDQRAWGPSSAGIDWNVNDYMWLRLRREPNMDGFNDVFGRVWPAGNTPEPATWSIMWDRESSADRAGLAGLVTNSISGQGEFEVDYVLIMAAGLPSVRAVPEPASALLLTMAGIVFGAHRRRRR